MTMINLNKCNVIFGWWCSVPALASIDQLLTPIFIKI